MKYDTQKICKVLCVGGGGHFRKGIFFQKYIPQMKRDIFLDNAFMLLEDLEECEDDADADLSYENDRSYEGMYIV